MNNPVTIHLSTAVRIGPLAMALFLLFLSLLDEDGFNEDSISLMPMLFFIGSIFTTIIAFISSFLLFNLFEMISSYSKLSLSAQAMYYYFLPCMLCSFGLVTLFLWSQGIHPEARALTLSTDIAALLGWSIYSYEKLKATAHKPVIQRI